MNETKKDWQDMDLFDDPEAVGIAFADSILDGIREHLKANFPVTKRQDLSTSADESEQLRQRVRELDYKLTMSQKVAKNLGLKVTAVQLQLDEARRWARFLYRKMIKHGGICSRCGWPYKVGRGAYGRRCERCHNTREAFRYD